MKSPYSVLISFSLSRILRLLAKVMLLDNKLSTTHTHNTQQQLAIY
jgi:hypothetical protein